MKTQHYFRTLSYREFFTAIALALVLSSIQDAVDYFIDDVITNSIAPWAFVAALPFIGHVWYKREHKRSNDFMGRNFNDYLFILLAFVVMKELRKSYHD